MVKDKKSNQVEYVIEKNQNPKNSLLVATINVRSYKRNRTAIESLINSNKFDIIILTETWL